MSLRNRRRWWLPFGAGAALVVVALGWVSNQMLTLERGEAQARNDADHALVLRLALWRMDSWLAPQVAPEAARPYIEYAPYYEANFALRNGDSYSQVAQGEILTPSPLLNFRSDYLKLHFQLPRGGALTSPQAPTGRFRDAAEGQQQVVAETLTENTIALESVQPLVDFDALRARVVAVEERLQASFVDHRRPGAVAEWAVPGGRGDNSWRDYAGGLNSIDANRDQKRRRANVSQQALNPQQNGAGQSANIVTDQPAPQDPNVARVGPMVPVWVPSAADPQALLFVRRAVLVDGEVLQGIVADWPRLERGLKHQVEDLFPDVQLVPVAEAGTIDEDAGLSLATLPVELRVPPPTYDDEAGLSPVEIGLGVTWLAMLLAIGAAGFSLHKSVAYGERRSQFASTVTHELRTPLTTFKMYSEMLAEGMVKDEAQRQEYLETLHDQAGRLSTVVENVLAYSRIEQGRASTRRAQVEVGALLARCLPQLERRAAEVGSELRVDVQGPPNASVNVDQAAVEQILFNLVDNACKYGRSTERPWIDVTVRAQGGRLRVEVRDHGPGIDRRARKLVFEPFERGDEATDHAVPGVGLGLALSRGLARDQGGDLRLETGDSDGACFVLDLPA